LPRFDEIFMEAEDAVRFPARSRYILLVGAFVVGWSASRAIGAQSETQPLAHAEPPVATPDEPVERDPRSSWRRRPVRLALVGVAAAMAFAGVGLAFQASDARAPLVDPVVAAQERAQAAKQGEAARLHLLRRLELAGIAGRLVGSIEPPKVPAAVRPAAPHVQPSERAIALDNYLQALGTRTILTGLDASRDQLQQQLLNDPRVSIYPAGRGDVSSGRVDVRVLAVIEYLAQANGSVSVSCLISGHSLYVHGRPGVVSAHIYGRAVDVSAVGGTPILGHQGAGSVTERAIREILALPASVEPLQVISLMTLGGPSFALPDHYNHIHIGY
jgi:hypothetical protein